jgi:hypothetical protein
MSNEKFVATSKLRWLRRPLEGGPPQLYLQQWFAENLPSYMRNDTVGEWRDIETVDLELTAP